MGLSKLQQQMTILALYMLLLLHSTLAASPLNEKLQAEIDAYKRKQQADTAIARKWVLIFMLVFFGCAFVVVSAIICRKKICQRLADNDLEAV
jgi:hypothetical protein